MTTQTQAAPASARPRTRRKGSFRLVKDGFQEIIGRRRLTRYLVGAEMKRTHADTAFGQLWWILDPLMQMGVYYILVSVIFQRDTPDFPLFLFAAILPWKWFSTTLGEATLSVTGHQSLIRQIQFPKIVLPTASVVAGTASFLFGLIALGLVYLFYLHRLSIWVLAIPIIALVQFVFTLALAILLSGFNAFFRDVQNVLRHLLRLWFYLSPGLYSLDTLDKNNASVAAILSLNPFAILFKSYRAVTYGTSHPDWIGLAVLLAFSLVLLGLAVLVFKRLEPAFARIL